MHLVIQGSSSEEGKLGGTQTQEEETSDREQGLIRALEPKGEVYTEVGEGPAEEGSWKAAASEKVKRHFHRDRAAGLLRGLQKRP